MLPRALFAGSDGHRNYNQNCAIQLLRDEIAAAGAAAGAAAISAAAATLKQLSYIKQN